MCQNISKYEKHKEDLFKKRVIRESTREAEVAAALDWGLRETSREAAVPPRLESKQKSNIAGDDQELPGQGDRRCLHHEARKCQKVPGPVSIIPASPAATKLSPKE